MQPGAAAEHGQLGGGHIEGDHGIQPQACDLSGLAQIVELGVGGIGVPGSAGGLRCARDAGHAGGGAPGDVLGHLPVHRAVALGGEHALHLRGGGTQLRRVLGQVRLLSERRQVQPVEGALGECVPEGLLEEALERLFVHIARSTRDRISVHGHLQQSVGAQRTERIREQGEGFA